MSTPEAPSATDVLSDRLRLHLFTPPEADRVVRRAPGSSDRWDADYPLIDEIDVLTAFVERAQRGEAPAEVFGLYSVHDRETGTSIGGIGFFGPPNADGVVELGYGLVPSVRGRGLASEALRALVVVARENGARAVIADTTLDNVASQRVLLAAGFAELGRRDSLLLYRLDL